MKPGISMLWRTLLVIAAALLLSAVFAVVLLGEYVSKPQTARGTEQFVDHLKTIGAALETMDDRDEAEFIRRIREREGVVIERAASPFPLPGMSLAQDRRIMRVFPQLVQEAFGRDASLYVRDQDERHDPPMIWVMLPLKSAENYWVGFPVARIEPLPLSGIVLWTGAGLLISLAASLLIVWRLTRPLDVLATAADGLGDSADVSPVPEKGPAEIRAVARAFNRMRERLAKNERDKATFLAGISHDLRTPLGHLRLEAAMLKGHIDAETHANMLVDMDDMNAIIDQFIDYSRSEATETAQPVDLSALVRECVERWTRTGVAVRCELAHLPPIALRPLAMQRLLNNLLGNAVRHAGRDIEVRTKLADGTAVLSVLDRGPGIPPATAERLKEPFTRRDDARSGSSGAGLGLAIVDRVARLHGGHVDLLEREGGGLEARVTLPA